jgi:hypothetical protein
MMLNKFGAILKFAIELEESTAAFYGGAESGDSDEGLGERSREAARRVLRLQTMRRELVNEMLLEPVTDFESPSLPELDKTDLLDRDELKKRILQLERVASDFYVEASEKLASIAPAVGRSFKRMAQQRKEP